jgi:thymidylate synthase (FAD)
MKIIKQSWEFMAYPDGEAILKLLEAAGRVCYKTEGKIGDGTAAEFIRKRIKTGHESVIEHANVSVRIISDRGVTHELVRHRLASYSQESTRYCNYSKDSFDNEIAVILPVWLYDVYDEGATQDEAERRGYFAWLNAMWDAQEYYMQLLKLGWSPQEARDVLPNGLKTEIIMTCNIREWRHFFKMRTSPAAHPQMKALAAAMLSGFKEAIPVLFEDIDG